MTARLLLVAKAPITGEAKTRLGADVGMAAAAELAAASLLDTIEVANATFPGSCHLALAGDLSAGIWSDDLRAALEGWVVFEQVGSGLGARLAHAHAVLADSGPGPVVQIGMDTPQLTPDLLRDAVAGLADADAVIGPAEDGGWWLLALADANRAAILTDVPMSDPQTCRETIRALSSTGAVLASLPSLCDVDTGQDAAVVAAAAPTTRFAGVWRRVTSSGAAAS